MQIGILATEDRKTRWDLAKTGHTYTWVQDTQTVKNFDVFLDLNFDEHPERILNYAGNMHTIFLLSAVNLTPEMALKNQNLKYKGEKFFGINANPTFIERDTLEISNPFQLNPSLIEDLQLRNTHEWVQSRIGMVTPRIVFMIINEAYYTFQEGTAEKSDIDTAMKLGTNYPKGPFEWCEEAGINNVYNTLKAIFEDTGDERYKICSKLKSEWIQKNTML